MLNEVLSVEQRLAQIEAIRADFPTGCEGCPELRQCFEVIEVNVSFPTGNHLKTAGLALTDAVKISNACEQGQPNQRTIFGRTIISCASPLK